MNSPTLPTPPAATGTSFGQWMALIAALLGWMFDGAEMGVFSMVGNSAVRDLLGPEHADKAGSWFGVIIATFLVGAATGGVVFGWLGDRIGRVRAMSLSVLVYALFTGFCGFANSVEQLAALRFIASLGMGGEWSLGVALVMEVWPNKSRALMAGLIGAAANAGYLLVGVVGLVLDALLKDQIPGWLGSLGLSPASIEILVREKGWRLLMMLGTTPALLTFLFRMFVPESEKWLQERGKGQTSNWATVDLLGVLIGGVGPALIIFVWASKFGLPVRITVTLIGLVIATFGYMYPVVRFLQRCDLGSASDGSASKRTLRLMLLAACLSGVALLGTWGSTQWAAKWAGELTQNQFQSREWTQIWLALGAITGTILAAFMGDWLGRRMAYFILCVLALGSALFFFQFNHAYGPMFLASSFVAGMCTASFYGWLPLYLPELFSTKVRATGQGFSFNFGRILAAIGALQTGALTDTFKDRGGIPAACSVMSLVYVAGMVLIWLAPETKGQPLPE